MPALRMAKRPRNNSTTRDYLDGQFDDPDHDSSTEKLDGKRDKAQSKKMHLTVARRNAAAVPEVVPTDGTSAAVLSGFVLQVYSLYCDVRCTSGQDTGTVYRCTMRKTLARTSETAVVVGDLVTFRPQVQRNDAGTLHATIESVAARKSLLTRSDSFKAITAHPIVANADQMLIVISMFAPKPKWGLVDRMLAAALGGGLAPVIALTKTDLATPENQLATAALAEAREILTHYAGLGFASAEFSIRDDSSPGRLAALLADKTTVLAGHSGVGKSSLIRLVAPGLDIRVAEISVAHQKGKHTTTSARYYDLPQVSASVIDTPGVKLFGLWQVTEEVLERLFADMEAGTAPEWRQESYQRIVAGTHD